jgi:hypothetical protein
MFRIFIIDPNDPFRRSLKMVPKDDWTGEDMTALVQSILSDLEIDEQGDQDPDKPRRQTS